MRSLIAGVVLAGFGLFAAGLVLIWRGAWREEGADGIEARTPLKPGPYWCSELDWSE